MKKMLSLCLALSMAVLILSCNSIPTGNNSETSIKMVERETEKFSEGVFRLDSPVEVPDWAIEADNNIEGTGPPEIFVPTAANLLLGSFSPGGRFIRTATQLINPASLTAIRTFKKGYSTVYSKDGSVFYTSENDKIVCRDSATGDFLKTIDIPFRQLFPYGIGQIYISSDSRYIAAMDWKATYFWDIEKNILAGEYSLYESGQSPVGFIPGTSIVVLKIIKIENGKINDVIIGWDVAADKQIWSFEIQGSSQMAIKLEHIANSDNIILLTNNRAVGVGEHNIIKVNGRTGSNEVLLSDLKNVANISLHPDGKHLFVFHSDYRITMANIDSEKVLAEFNIKKVFKDNNDIQKVFNSFSYYRHFTIDVSPDGRLLIFDIQGLSGIYNLKNGETFISPTYPTKNSVYHLPSINSTGKKIAIERLDAGTLSPAITVWDTSTGQILKENQESFTFYKNIEALYNQPVMLSALTSTEDFAIDFTHNKIIDLNTGKKIGSFKIHSLPYAGTVSADGTLAAILEYDSTIRIWDTRTGRNIKTIQLDEMTGLLMRFSPDRQRLYCGGLDGLQVFDLDKGKRIGRFVAFADGGWVSISESGYFSGNEAGISKIKVRMGNCVLPLDSFYDQFYNPLEVAAAFSSEPRTAQSAQPKLAISDITIAPPKVNLFIETANGSFINANQPAAAGIIHEKDTVKIRVEALSSAGKIGEIKVRNNGKLLDQNIRGLAIMEELNRVVQEFNIPIIEGSNKITAVALSEQFIESAPVQITVQYNPVVQSAPDMYVIAVGIDQYKNKRYSLDYAVGDVKGFIKSLLPIAEPLYDEVFQTVIINDNAVKENILSQLEVVAAKAQPEDVFVFYYAGHGIALTENQTGMKNEFYYVLHDVTQMTSVDGVRDSGISGSEIREIFSRIPAQKQIAMIDACNSGAMAETFAYRGAAEEQALAKLSRATGSVIIAATRDDQFAAELASLGHGAFTMAVIEALDGKAVTSNQQITASSIRLYLDDRLPEITAEHSGSEQYPISFIFGQDFPIGISP